MWYNSKFLQVSSYGMLSVVKRRGITLSKNRRFFHEASFSVDKIVVARRDGMSNTVLFELDIIV